MSTPGRCPLGVAVFLLSLMVLASADAADRVLGPTLATIAQAAAPTVPGVVACQPPAQLNALVVLTDQGLPRAALLASDQDSDATSRDCVHAVIRDQLRVPMPKGSRPAKAMLTYELGEDPRVVVPVGLAVFPLVGALVLDPGQPAPPRSATEWEMELLSRLGSADRLLGTVTLGPVSEKKLDRVLGKHQDQLAACGLALPSASAFLSDFVIVEGTVLGFGEVLVERVYGTDVPDVEACVTTASADWRLPSRDGDTRFAVPFIAQPPAEPLDPAPPGR